MNKTIYQSKSEHVFVQFLKNLVSKFRQNPDVYPIRYYKKSRKPHSSLTGRGVK